MSYDDPIHGHYHWDTFDFGGDADATYYISGPAGCKGKLISIGASTSEEFACSVTAAGVLVGVNGNTDAYAQMNIPDETAVNTVYNSGDDTDAIISADIAADTQVVVTLTQSVDGAADAGKAAVDIFIDWYK